MKKFLTRLILTCLTASGLFLSSTYIALADDPYVGQYYELKTPQNRQDTTPSNKVEVLEFFWYGCGHCYNLEYSLSSWLKKKPSYVEFKHIPAVYDLNSRWAYLARAYYTAEALGVLDKIHVPLFKAIHQKRQYELLNNVDAIQQFFAKYGVVSKKDFYKEYASFSMHVKISKAISLTEQYNLQGVPAIIVNGKYRLPGKNTRSHESMMTVLDYLIEKERKQ